MRRQGSLRNTDKDEDQEMKEEGKTRGARQEMKEQAIEGGGGQGGTE